MSNVLYDGLFKRHTDQTTPFITTPDGNVTTHADFLQLAARYANALTVLGLQKGDRVALQVEKSVEAITVYAACVRAGLVFLPLNTAYTAAELDYFINDSSAGLFVCDGRNEGQLTPVAEQAGATLLTLNADGCGSFSELARTQPDEFVTVDVGGDELAALLYTSGTTGRSKGAMLTQHNLLSNATVLADYWQFTAPDVLLHALPIFHTHGLFVAINTLLVAGASMIMLPTFNLEQMIVAMPQATSLMGVPTFYTRLLSDLRFDRALTKNMRLFISGSAPLLATTHREFKQRTGHRILERYGMTETNMNTSNPYNGERRAGTVGLALPGVELKITDPESGVELANGETGLLEVRGANVFKGYWRMPDKTREELREDGFFITGDLGMRDDAGYVTIIGRNKDLIISGGFNIYPKEIELLLDKQDGVLESAVIAVPHPDFGETPLGILVRQPGAEPDVTLIQQNITAALARFKHPRQLVVVDELPRNTMGKVQKNVLRDQYAGLFAPVAR